MTTVPFLQLIEENTALIQREMRWENYELNDTTIQVTETIRNDAINVLKRSYGKIQVERDVLDEFLNDVFMYFPSLLQQLAITRLIDSLGVVKDDTDRTVLTRNENLSNEIEQSGSASMTNRATDTTTLNTQNKTTGTVSDAITDTHTQSSMTEIENISGVEATGVRNVNLSHNLPEQAIDQENGNFPTDQQGTPILSTSYVQQANEGFSTSNPINSSESSTQTITNTDSRNSTNTTTNDVTMSNTGTTGNVSENIGSDTNENTTVSTGINTITETIESTTTNKQYAYEIKAFLETADSINAFKIWENRFSWIEGII